MTSPETDMSTPDGPDRRPEPGRRSDSTARRALVWLALVAAAVFPYPWWW